jgi:hypothetical protein
MLLRADLRPSTVTCRAAAVIAVLLVLNMIDVSDNA